MIRGESRVGERKEFRKMCDEMVQKAESEIVKVDKRGRSENHINSNESEVMS